MSDIISLDEVIETTSQIIEDQKYSAKTASDPRKKRQAKSAIKFWTSINHHLKEYKSTKSTTL